MFFSAFAASSCSSFVPDIGSGMTKRGRSEGRSPSVFRQNAKKCGDEMAIYERIATALEEVVLELRKANELKTGNPCGAARLTVSKDTPTTLQGLFNDTFPKPVEVARRVFDAADDAIKRKRKGQTIRNVGDAVVMRVDGKEFDGVVLRVPADLRSFFSVLCSDGSEKMAIARNLRLRDDAFNDDDPCVTPPSAMRVAPATPCKDRRPATPAKCKRLVEAVAPELPIVCVGDRVSYIENGVPCTFEVHHLGIFGASSDGRNWVKTANLTRV